MRFPLACLAALAAIFALPTAQAVTPLEYLDRSIHAVRPCVNVVPPSVGWGPNCRQSIEDFINETRDAIEEYLGGCPKQPCDPKGFVCHMVAPHCTPSLPSARCGWDDGLGRGYCPWPGELPRLERPPVPSELESFKMCVREDPDFATVRVYEVRFGDAC